eukprot:2776953-Pyramimonas_sp.AAC.1
MRRGSGVKGTEDHCGELWRWSSQRVWHYWQILPISDELRLRRLRWYQSWIRFPSAHRQV